MAEIGFSNSAAMVRSGDALCDIVRSRISHFDRAIQQLVDQSLRRRLLMTIDRRRLLQAARNHSALGSTLQIESRPSLPVAHPHRREAQQITRSGSATDSLNWRRIASFPPPPITGSFPARCCASRKASRSLSISITTPIRPSSCTGTGRPYPVDVDGASEEGTPFIPAHGMRRISFTPGPAGLRFYHTHLAPGADLSSGQYGGQVGTVYIEPKHEPRPLRSRSISDAQGIPAGAQSRRRYGDGFSGARDAGQGA